MHAKHKQFLDQYLQQLSPVEKAHVPQVIAEYFCADEYNANECARLINAGIKTATCSLHQAYEKEDEPLPQVGRLTVVLDWDEEPVCIVKVTDVAISPFNQVTEEFAKAEGEGDGSYEWWRNAHFQFFTEYAASLGLEFNEGSKLVLERFEKVYPF